MTGIGPIEPANSTETQDSYDVIGVDAQCLTDRLATRWTTLPSRTRTAALAAAAAATATAATLLLAPTGTPDRNQQPPPVPWPANVTTWHYLGLGATPGPQTPSGLFRFAVQVESGPPVTLRVTGAAFPGLHARATPEPAFTVHTGTTRRITVEISVSDCSDLPLNANLPFLDVTLRNARAIQHHSFIFGRAYSDDLSALLRRTCEP
jgi:hypothetical protein